MALQVALDDGSGLMVVLGEHTLIELGLRQQGGFIAQHDMQERKLRDIARPEGTGDSSV
jgi:hypothetical protein